MAREHMVASADKKVSFGKENSDREDLNSTVHCCPPFPPLHTVHAAFTAHGVPSVLK